MAVDVQWQGGNKLPRKGKMGWFCKESGVTEAAFAESQQPREDKLVSQKGPPKKFQSSLILLRCPQGTAHL